VPTAIDPPVDVAAAAAEEKDGGEEENHGEPLGFGGIPRPGVKKAREEDCGSSCWWCFSGVAAGVFVCVRNQQNR